MSCAALYHLPYIGVIDRPDPQEILLDECKQIKPDSIQNENHVESYQSQAVADLLVGSDGIWSALRAQMYGEEVKKIFSQLEETKGL